MFVYILEGSVVVSLDGKGDTVAAIGQLVTVPFKQVYAARTSEDGAELVIFRVHEANQPVRFLAE